MAKQRGLSYQRLFKASPGKILVLLPGSLEIVAVTDEYLKATMTRENEIIGKTLFDVFPDNPDDPISGEAEILLSSLERVQSLKAPDIVGIIRYPIRSPDGTFVERFWAPVNSPVLDDSGNVEFIMHRVEDVTAIVNERIDSPVSEVAIGKDPLAIQDILLRSRELKQALTKLQEHEARIRTAERLLNLGTWEYYPETGTLNWSKQVYDIYDVPAHHPAPDVDEYFALLHPSDREASRNVYADFTKYHTPQIEFEHRIIVHDGSVRYIKGVGERHQSADGEIVVGYVQDITSIIKTRHKLNQAEQLLRLAGEKAQLGGWRVQLDPAAVTWTPETAAIHGKPAHYSPPSVKEAIEFYAPKYRDLIKRAFERCALEGTSFDVICQLQTFDGRLPWVRAIGEAEQDDQGKIIAVQGALQDISALREAQLRADDSEQQRLNILESISDAFFALDDRWNFTYLNQKAGLLLERPRSELLGKNVWEEFPEAVDSEFQRQYEYALESQQTCQFRALYPPLDKWFDITAYPIPDGLAVYFRDVTRELARQEQLRLIDAALSRQNDIVMITEADKLDEPDGPHIVYVNDAFERLTGYTRSEVIGRSPRFLQGPESNRKQLDSIRQALHNKEPIRCEILNYSKAGHPYWLELDITPLFDADGLCTHFVAVERDITERKRQETELHQAWDRFELISRATNDVIWDWTFATEKVWWNDAITTVFGYTLSDLEPGPESWTLRIHPDDHDRVVQSIYSIINGNEELWSHEYRFARSDGQYANVIDRGFVIRDAQGKAVRMVGSLLDNTERMELEERLRESQKLEAVGHLTGGVAHDFNNLLTVILGNAEMMAELSADSTLKPMADMTLSAAKRGAELTSRLLAFARRQPLDPKATDLNQLTQAMQGLIRRTLPENIELEFIPEQELGIAEIDAGELDTALLNLVVNARDAMPRGGKLTIETANVFLDKDYADRNRQVEPGEYVMICVTDTGVGMEPETVSRAFEPFFTTKEVGKGSGLGLSMVFGFTKQSGGHIKIYSEKGEGTAIKLYFPRIKASHHTSYLRRSESPVQGGTEHILIAEDDDMVLTHLAGQLRSLGYHVTAVRSGPEALEVLYTQKNIDLLLTDIIMPGGMNGRELADQVHALYPEIKILFTSGYTENAIVHHGRLDPGVELLSKPYTRQELAIKVRRVIDGFNI